LKNQYQVAKCELKISGLMQVDCDFRLRR